MLYDIKRNGVTLVEHEIKGKRIKSAPAVDYIEVEFDYFEPVLLKKNDTIEFKGDIYYCDKQSVNVFKKSTNLYNHRARFLGENYKATEIALLSPDFHEHNFDIEGNLLTLVTLAVSNLNRIDSGWSFNEDLPATITKKFDIKEENVMSFLAKVSGEFEIPFRIENKVITFAYYEHPDGGEFEYGKGKGFLDLKKSYRNGDKAPNTIFATGGNGFQLNDPVQDDDDVDENGVIEGFYTNERIYPTTKANVLSSVQSNVFRTDLDFSIYANSIPGQRALINFETGALAGLSFFLQFEQYNLDGIKILTITKRYVDGVEYPNLLARPLGGDRYNVTNINMPQDAIDDATQRLTIATQNYLRNILDRNLVLDANLDPLYQEDLKLNDRIKIVDADLDINGYFIINEIKEDLQNLNRKEITLDYVGKNLLNLNLPVVNDNIIEVEIEEINTEIQDIIVETGSLKFQVGNKVDLSHIVANLSDTNPLNIPNVTAVNNGLYQTLSTANQYTDTAIEGAVYNVTYESETHEITFYRHQQPNIVIDLPAEQLITGVELVGNDLIFTFEDGSVVTVPMNTLLVGVVKKVNGLTPNSQGEVVINIADIPVLSSELDSRVVNTRTITAGNGLTGGGNLTANRTITLGTPSAITLTSTNSVTSSSHTHAFTPGGTTAQYIRGDGSLATYVDTTYTAGTGLSLSGTTFGQTITTSGTGTYVQSITQTANGFQVNLGTPPNTNTTYTGSNGIVVSGTVISPTYGTTSTTIARGDHKHTFLTGWSDTRTVDTVPNDYNSKFEAKGIKQNSTLGLNATTYGTYTSVVGYRGWSGSSGGNAFELGFAGSGQLLYRSGASTSWGAWNEIYHSGNFTDAITSISRNGVTIPIVSQNVNIPVFSTSGAGLVPARVGSTSTKYLREDGTWVTPTNTTYSAGTGLSLTGTTFTNTAPNATHTGDVTGATYLTIANNAVTNIKMAQMNANSIKGRSGSIGNPQDLTPAQVRTMLNVQEGANRTRIGINGGNYTEVGDINLIAGSNVSLSKSGQNITINSASQPIDTTVKVYMPGEVLNNDTVNCEASKTIIYLSPTFTGPLNIAIDPELQDGAELNVIHTSNYDASYAFNINGSLINLYGQISSSILASSKEKSYRFIYVKDLGRFALVDIGRV